MGLRLPSPASTNGTYLEQQALHALIRSMITRQGTWHPRLGTDPGLGSDALRGVVDVFTATATAALELGALAYARGVVETHFRFYVRDDGMHVQRGVALPASCRALTVLALYHSYTRDDALLLALFPKARALAEWLVRARAGG